MYTRRDFDPADPGEDEDYAFDFSRDAEAGDAITGATWLCRVAEASKVDDPSASSRLSGSPTFSGLRTVQRVLDLQAGVKYVLQATVTTAHGHTKSLWSYVDCKEPG